MCTLTFFFDMMPFYLEWFPVTSYIYSSRPNQNYMDNVSWGMITLRSTYTFLLSIFLTVFDEHNKIL